MFVLYALVGLIAGLIYRRLPRRTCRPSGRHQARGPIPPHRLRLAALFSLECLAGGLVVQSLLALWLLERFGLSLAMTGVIFFVRPA